MSTLLELTLLAEDFLPLTGEYKKSLRRESMEIGDECLHCGEIWHCWLISESHYHLIRCEPQPLSPPLCRLLELPIESP